MKRVIYDPPVVASAAEPLGKCCERCSTIEAVPSVRIGDDGDMIELGYALDSTDCDCDHRWLPHDWESGPAKFVSFTGTAINYPQGGE